MKVNIFFSFIGVALASLIGFLAYNVAKGQENDLVCGISSTICFIATLIPSIGISYESGRVGTNIRVLSTLFFVIFLICHICFASFDLILPYYIIVNGILLLIYMAIFYKMAQSQEV